MCIKNVFSAVVLIAMCAFASAAQCSDADRAALEQFDRTWGQHSQKGNRAELERIYADDYAEIGLLEIAARKNDAIESAVSDAANPNPPNVSFDTYLITCTPNTAVITHRNIAKDMIDGKQATFYSRSIHVLEKRDGRWQVVSNAGHPMVGDFLTAWNMQMDGVQAFQRRDAKWFEEHMADNYMDIGPSGEVMNKSQWLAALRDNKARYDDIQVSDMNIRTEGDTAVITGIYSIKGQTPDNRPLNQKMRFTRTMVKKDGQWQAIAAQVSMIPTQVAVQ